MRMLKQLPPLTSQRYWLSTALLAATLPHFERMPLWSSIFVCLLLLWNVLQAATRLPALPRWLLWLLALAAIAGVYASFSSLVGRQAGTAMLMVLAPLKLFESKTTRDEIVLLLIAAFLLITQFLFSESIASAAWMVLTFWLILLALAGCHGFSSLAQHPRQRLYWGSTLLLQALPLMLVLFVLFPRIPGPLWGLPEDKSRSISGLSDSMTVGNIAELVLSDEPAFRVQFHGTAPERGSLYWRGPVLWDFDGRSWTSPKLPEQTVNPLTVNTALRYTITLEPHGKRWLFALDMPASQPADTRLSLDYQLLAQADIKQRRRYELSAQPGDLLPQTRLSEWEQQHALALPAGGNPQARQLARQWQSGSQRPEQIIAKALHYFADEGFSYTLSPPRLGPDSVDDFMFRSRRGFCEHYASSFVYLMRAAGVPARVVTGYLGGELNAMGNYWLIRQSDAHAWTEVYIDGRGWLRIDPTSAVSAERISSGISRALPPAELPAALANLDSSWLKRPRQTWDMLNNSWNQWVLGYNQDKQAGLLQRLHPALASWQGMIAALAGLLALITALIAWRMFTRLAPRPDPARRLYDRFCRKLARAGIPLLPGEGPQALAQRVAALRPDMAAAIQQITGLYIALRYQPEGGSLLEMARAVRRLRVSRGTNKVETF